VDCANHESEERARRLRRNKQGGGGEAAGGASAGGGVGDAHLANLAHMHRRIGEYGTSAAERKKNPFATEHHPALLLRKQGGIQRITGSGMPQGRPYKRGVDTLRRMHQKGAKAKGERRREQQQQQQQQHQHQHHQQQQQQAQQAHAGGGAQAAAPRAAATTVAATAATAPRPSYLMLAQRGAAGLPLGAGGEPAGGAPEPPMMPPLGGEWEAPEAGGYGAAGGSEVGARAAAAVNAALDVAASAAGSGHGAHGGTAADALLTVQRALASAVVNGRLFRESDLEALFERTRRGARDRDGRASAGTGAAGRSQLALVETAIAQLRVELEL
jgi:hypothetical protein